MKNLAQIKLYPDEGFSGFGKIGMEGGGDAPSLFNKFISLTVGILTVIAAIWFLFLVITGAISWLSAGSDKTKVENARRSIANGIVGLFVVIAAIFIVELVGKLFGFDAILNPAELINRAWGN
jgi:hypothetical protein